MAEHPSALMAAFAGPDDLVDHARTLRAAGFERLDAFTPFPIDGLAEAIGFRSRAVPLAFLVGGIAGALAGFLMQVGTNLDYPLWIGGRFPVEPAAFMLITFEMTVLFSVVAGIGTMLAGNRLPRLHHPMFDARDFHRASRDRFFLAVWPRRGEEAAARQLLQSFGPLEIVEVPE